MPAHRYTDMATVIKTTLYWQLQLHSKKQ